MSFKSEAAGIRAGLKAGDYKKKVDVFKPFFDELSYGLKKRDEEKRLEEREKRQQARVIARATKAKQDAEDKAERERTDLVNFYLTSTGKDATQQNRAALMTVVKGGKFSDFASLDKHMSQYSTYTPGTSQEDIDSQMQSAGLLQPGDGPYQATNEAANKLSTEGTIEFTGSKGKDVMSMAIDEVRYELSSPNLTPDRKASLNRRLKSLTDPATYTATTLYKTDGSKVTARTKQEEAQYIAQGFSLVEGAKPTDFENRPLFKDGASVTAYSSDEYNQLVKDGWSAVKPKEPTPFTKRTLYKDGAEQEVFSQTELDAQTTAGWSAVKPAETQDFDKRYVYKDGAQLQVFSNQELTDATKAGWSPEKPAEEKVFAQRTLYGEDGTEVRVFTQSDLNTLTQEGWSNVKPAKEVAFAARTLYGAGRQIEVFSAAEMADALKLGYTSVKTDNEKYVARTYYKDGQEQRVLDQEQQDALEADGWDGIKLDSIAQIASDLNVDRKTAAQIENGVLKVSTDFGGNPIIIDISNSSSQPVVDDGEEVGMSTESLNAALSRVSPNWKENYLTITVDGENITFSPQDIQNNEAFKIQTKDLTGLNGAFGVSGVLNKLAGKAGDLAGAELKAEQNKAITFMENLRLNTLINLAAATAGGLRDSVWNKQQIIANLPEPARIFEGPVEARNKTTETLRSIQTSLKLLDQSLSSGTIAKAQISQSTITRAALRELEQTYKTVLEAFNGEFGETTPLPTSFIKKG